MAKPPPPPIPGRAALRSEEAPILDLDPEDLRTDPQPTVAPAHTPTGPMERKPARTAKPVEVKRFGRFELLLEMAKGGMATLFLARIRGPQNFEKLVVIKKIHDHLTEEQDFVDMFLDEARISAMIHHPNVAQIYDMGNIDNAYYIAMEYVHGQDLAQILRAVIRARNPTFGWPYAARIVADCAAGLHAAHELKNNEGNILGLVHRDVSPQNILISYDGHVKVVDFGIAYAAEKISVTDVGTLKGKAPYMSPEQTRGKKLDRRSDIFSLGILLYESCVLKRLFREENEAATLLRVNAADVPKPRSVRPDLPVELERILLKALAKDPADRYQTSAELQEALEKLLVSKGHMVGPTQIGKLMEELFRDRRKIRDQQIQEVLKRPPTKVGAALGVSATTVTRLDTMERDPPKRSWLLPVAISSVAVAVIALVLVLFVFRGKKDTKKPPAPPPGAMSSAPPMEPMEPMVVSLNREPAPPMTPTQVMLEIVVKPLTAKPTITFRGKRYTGNTVSTFVKPKETEEVIEISAKGYRTHKISLTVNQKMKIPVTLVRRARAWSAPRPMAMSTMSSDWKGLPD